MSADDDEPREPFGAEAVREMRKARLDRATAQYGAIVNRLWAGCGGGLIASVTAIRQPSDPFFWLTVSSFGFGVLLLAFGAFWSLIYETKVIRHLEGIDGILSMRIGYAERPSTQEGLSLSHPQTWTALAAAVLFIVGVVSAAAVVYRH